MSLPAPPAPRITYSAVPASPHVARLPGTFLTVVVACAYQATDALVPAGRTSEAYAWLILSIGAGQSAGTALAGRLAEHPLASGALPAAGAAFALAVLLTARSHLIPARSPDAGSAAASPRATHHNPNSTSSKHT